MVISLTRVMLMAAVLLAGCSSNRYEIVITPDGENFQRELTAWQTTTGQEGEKLSAMDQAELNHIARAYGVDPPGEAAQKHRFDGTFDTRTPDDVGGAGTLTVWSSRLGSTSLYIERFRGSNDLNASLATRHAAADELVDALLVWCEGELGDTDAGTAIEEFLTTRFGEDLRNLATWLWVARAVSDANKPEAENDEVIAGLMQFLFEKGYLSTDDLPVIMRIRSGTDPVILLDFLRRKLAEQTGVRESRLGFLGDGDRLQASINEHLKELPAARRFRDEAEGESKKPTDYLASLVVKIVAPALFSGSDQLDVVLRCPVKPFRTNGEWSDDEDVVTWSRHLHRRDEEPSGVLPVLLYASWAVPDKTFQQERFGRVFLKGEPLGQYCMWRNSLSEQQAAEWDAFLESLRPGQEFVAAIAEFRFSSDPGPDESGTSVSDRVRELILPHLRDETTSGED